jgi:hypothetical protein
MKGRFNPKVHAHMNLESGRSTVNGSSAVIGVFVLKIELYQYMRERCDCMMHLEQLDQISLELASILPVIQS